MTTKNLVTFGFACPSYSFLAPSNRPATMIPTEFATCRSFSAN